MEEERILKIHYRENCVDLTIDDVDKCLLIDVINDMCEEFGRRGFELPEYPGLHYCFKEKAIKLVDDGLMMKMFENIESKEIDVWDTEEDDESESGDDWDEVEENLRDLVQLDIGPLQGWIRWRFDPQMCYNENTNNFVESFNSTIGVDRSYPILTLLEGEQSNSPTSNVSFFTKW
uniref:Uncharacterized protein n=1 Tax=Chenopodium quinoa TaxID=63459 RepID=A0A803MD96_CHEQI